MSGNPIETAAAMIESVVSGDTQNGLPSPINQRVPRAAVMDHMLRADPEYIFTGKPSVATFSAIMGDRNDDPSQDMHVPLVMEPWVDEFGKLSLLLLYSDHDGVDALAFCARMLGFAAGNSEKIVRNPDIPWSKPTVPVKDPSIRSGISKDEVVFDIGKHNADFVALGDHVRKTGRTVKIAPDRELPVLQVLWKKRKCDNPGCQKRGTARCASCIAARYCGKNCQKAHWTNGHKQACSKAWCGVGIPTVGIGKDSRTEHARDDKDLNEKLKIWAAGKGISKVTLMDDGYVDNH